ncbi:hypothetical protein BIW11_03265 [Tropilaelaps mercedesae]|uniref:Uncharacterized protein n=1 Tax=Tropilaelaps mercedesae TaxID=418985 RepID=A0A1V9XPK8_9ACAR|nr:hypothetical protein BIW11_03265 [Tropilaelaps mercedesae]
MAVAVVCVGSRGHVAVGLVSQGVCRGLWQCAASRLTAARHGSQQTKLTNGSWPTGRATCAEAIVAPRQGTNDGKTGVNETEEQERLPMSAGSGTPDELQQRYSGQRQAGRRPHAGESYLCRQWGGKYRGGSPKAGFTRILAAFYRADAVSGGLVTSRNEESQRTSSTRRPARDLFGDVRSLGVKAVLDLNWDESRWFRVAQTGDVREPVIYYVDEAAGSPGRQISSNTTPKRIRDCDSGIRGNNNGSFKQEHLHTRTGVHAHMRTYADSSQQPPKPIPDLNTPRTHEANEDLRGRPAPAVHHPPKTGSPVTQPGPQDEQKRSTVKYCLAAASKCLSISARCDGARPLARFPAQSGRQSYRRQHRPNGIMSYRSEWRREGTGRVALRNVHQNAAVEPKKNNRGQRTPMRSASSASREERPRQQQIQVTGCSVS